MCRFGGQCVADALGYAVGFELEELDMHMVLGGVDVGKKVVEHGRESGIGGGGVAFFVVRRKHGGEGLFAFTVEQRAVYWLAGEPGEP